ncbi:hypothetical protein A2U01_0071569, partial [Trifolium medium]|nr:hypothetical protein [Trifolium medium]
MITREKGKIVGSLMVIRIRRVVKVAEEEGRAVDFVISVVKWGINHMSAQRRRTNVLGVEGWGIGPMSVERRWSALT